MGNDVAEGTTKGGHNHSAKQGSFALFFLFFNYVLHVVDTYLRRMNNTYIYYLYMCDPPGKVKGQIIVI